MPLGEKVEQAKDHKYFGIKGVFRKGKQLTMEKLGKAERQSEGTEFRSCVDRTNLLKSSYKTLASSILAIAGAVEGFNVNFGTIAESFESFAQLLTESPLSSSLTALIPGFREVREYCNAFYENTKTNIVPVFERVSKTAVEELEKTKKSYNSLRYEHDEVKISLDKAMGKEFKGSNQEKIARLQRDYNDLHVKYLDYQLEYMAKSRYLEAIIQRDAGLALMTLSRELINWSGQVYRILSQQTALLDSTYASLNALPEPEYIPPAKTSAPADASGAPKSPTAAAGQSAASDGAATGPQTGIAYPPGASPSGAMMNNDQNPASSGAGML